MTSEKSGGRTRKCGDLIFPCFLSLFGRLNSFLPNGVIEQVQLLEDIGRALRSQFACQIAEALVYVNINYNNCVNLKSGLDCNDNL